MSISGPTLFHLAVLAVPRTAAGAARRLAAATMTPTRVQREDGVAFAADDRHEQRRNQRNEDEDGRDDNDRCQRLGSVLCAYHVDKLRECSKQLYFDGTGLSTEEEFFGEISTLQNFCVEITIAPRLRCSRRFRKTKSLVDKCQEY